MAIPPQMLLQLLPMLLSMGGQSKGAGGSPSFLQGLMQGALPMLGQGAANSPAPPPLRGGALGSALGIGK